MRAELSRLHRRLGTTMIYVTHDQVEAMTMGSKIVIMKDGEIQQVGRPLDIYRRPINRFVAGFIGSPAMNFFPARLVERSDGLFVEADAFRVPVPGAFCDGYGCVVGRNVVFGIRPEDIHSYDFIRQHQIGYLKECREDTVICGEVEVIEPLGPEILVVVRCQDRSITARLDPHVELEIGQTINLALDMGKMHIFEGRWPPEPGGGLTAEPDEPDAPAREFQERQHGTMRLQGKKIALIVANEFEDIELLYPILRLSEEGADILVSAVKSGQHPRPHTADKPVTGRFGHTVPIPVMPEGRRYRLCPLDGLAAENLDCLIIPGGFSPDSLRLNGTVLELTRSLDDGKKVLAAICHGPWVLISAGIMSGRRATGFAAVRDDLQNAGAEYVDEPAVRDGNIVTGRVPNDLPEFCREIIGALSE